MSKTEIILQFGIYVVPSIAFFAAVYYFTNKWVEIQRDKKEKELVKPQMPVLEKNEFKKHFFPLQVDAYQRLVLFLERIAPNNLIMRLNNPGLPARTFQQNLLNNIRQEYEHNLAQQIFVSPESWHMVKNSKEEVIKIINMAATSMEQDALANDLSKGVFEITAQLDHQPTDKAIAVLKAELNKML